MRFLSKAHMLQLVEDKDTGNNFLHWDIFHLPEQNIIEVEYIFQPCGIYWIIRNFLSHDISRTFLLYTVTSLSCTAQKYFNAKVIATISNYWTLDCWSNSAGFSFIYLFHLISLVRPSFVPNELVRFFTNNQQHKYGIFANQLFLSQNHPNIWKKDSPTLSTNYTKAKMYHMYAENNVFQIKT